MHQGNTRIRAILLPDWEHCETGYEDLLWIVQEMQKTSTITITLTFLQIEARRHNTMVAVSPNGGRPRGRLIVVAAIMLIAMLSLAIVLGGCGGSSEQGASTSQLDDQGVGASTGTSTVAGVGSTGGSATGVSGQGNVLVDYQWDQCTTEMTKYYGDLETANKVCSTLQSDYGSSQQSQLPTILPKVEASVGATPVPGSPMPGTGGQTGNGSGSNTSTTGGNTGSSGWGSGGIEITVPADQTQ